MDELAKRYGMTQRDLNIFTRFHHLHHVWLAPEATLHDLLHAALGGLPVGWAADYLCFCHAIHDNSVAGNDLLDLLTRSCPRKPEGMAFTQGACASGALALQWLKHQLRPGQGALVLSGEKCFHPRVQYVGQKACYGEIAVAVLLEASPGPGWQLVAAESALIGGYSLRMIKTSREAESLLDRAFFPAMANLIGLTLAQARLTQDHIAAIVPDYVSSIHFDRLAELGGFERGCVFRENLAGFGHCFCSDPFLTLGTAALKSRLTPSQRHVLALATGVTGSLAALIFEYREADRYEHES